MAIAFKDYQKTIHQGLYVSKETFDEGHKYLARFQVDGKKYTKVLGYFSNDSDGLEAALDAMNVYKSSFAPNTSSPMRSTSQLLTPVDQELLKIAHKYHGLLDNIPKLEQALKRRYEKEQLIPYQIELIKLQNYLDKHQRKMVILFEGRDAAGKGGAIRTISRYMNGKHYRIVALGKPSNTQKTQWYFQRYVEQLPRAGEIVLFDRSWYNRAMVEPVFGFCTPAEYERFLLDIRPFEEGLIRNDVILVKLYYSVSKQIQQQRFVSREKNPLKRWKLSEVDLQAQSLWEVFTKKKTRMLQESEIAQAPWHIIRADNKFQTRLESIKTILRSVDYEDRNADLNYEKDASVVFGAKEELRLMKE